MSFFKSLTKAIANEALSKFSESKPYEPGRGDNPYGPGRPYRYYPINESGNIPPSEPGEYRINGSKGYIGESSSLRRRMNDHVRSGRISNESDYFEYKIAHENSTTEDRRRHEKEKTDQHNPQDNQRRGGAGRKPNNR